MLPRLPLSGSGWLAPVAWRRPNIPPISPQVGVTTRKCSECTTSGTLSELRPPVEIAAAAAL
jgi:hypothetical protein